jgi:hypothetical protein
MLKLVMISAAAAMALAARMESRTSDPFVGVWKLNPAKSRFDPNHRPTEGAMTFELDADGAYVMRAEGKKENGQRVVEQPQRFVPDGKPRPLPGMPNLIAVSTRPDPNTIQGEVKREDGSIVGGGTYAVSADGKTLTATVAGFDAQLREFKMITVWDRE